MSAARKIIEAEHILINLENVNNNFKSELERFTKTISDVFSHLLDEYNVKFGLKTEHISLEKFKTLAKKAGKIEAINFLIWYEKEYKKIKNNSDFGHLLEKESTLENNSDTIRSCSALLNEIKKMTYYAYENF